MYTITCIIANVLSDMHELYYHRKEYRSYLSFFNSYLSFFHFIFYQFSVHCSMTYSNVKPVLSLLKSHTLGLKNIIAMSQLNSLTYYYYPYPYYLCHSFSAGEPVISWFNSKMWHLSNKCSKPQSAHAEFSSRLWWQLQSSWLPKWWRLHRWLVWWDLWVW